MAQRFGGKFSPDARDVPDAGGSRMRPDGSGPGGAPGPRRHRGQVDPGGARTNLLFLPPVLVAATTLGGGPVAMATGLVAAALWALGAWLTREGLRAEAAFHARKIARRPALPRKILGSATIALGTALAAAAHGTDVVGSALYGLVAGSLHMAAFGIDPLQDKSVAGVDTVQRDRVARVVDEAEAHLSAIRDAIAPLRDRRLNDRVAAFTDTARSMISTVEGDPRDLTSARKFLGVYLMGARDASVKFADVYARTRSAEARAQYEALLDDLEQNFAARTDRLLLDDRSDLTVEIDVLRDRLQREGVRTSRNME